MSAAAGRTWWIDWTDWGYAGCIFAHSHDPLICNHDFFVICWRICVPIVTIRRAIDLDWNSSGPICASAEYGACAAAQDGDLQGANMNDRLLDSTDSRWFKRLDRWKRSLEASWKLFRFPYHDYHVVSPIKIILVGTGSTFQLVSTRFPNFLDRTTFQQKYTPKFWPHWDDLMVITSVTWIIAIRCFSINLCI
jgi:hypothetical protein